MADPSMWGDIQIGERVRLKAGGPVMTVEAFDGADGVYCYWDEQGERKRDHLKSEALVKVSDEGPQPPDSPVMSAG